MLSLLHTSTVSLSEILDISEILILQVVLDLRRARRLQVGQCRRDRLMQRVSLHIHVVVRRC